MSDVVKRLKGAGWVRPQAENGSVGGGGLAHEAFWGFPLVRNKMRRQKTGGNLNNKLFTKFYL